MSNKTVTIVSRGSSCTFPVIDHPVPHILVTRKNFNFHGWSYYDYQSAGKRECTHERWPLNPYGNCNVGCPFCYAQVLGTYPKVLKKDGVVVVFDGYPSMVDKALSKMHCGCTGYLSTSTDPFQEIEGIYHHSESVIDLFTKLNLPIEFITKKGSNVPDRVFEAIARQEHSFVQFTILTEDNRKLKTLSPGASFYSEQVDAIRRAKARGVKHIVARFDPIVPLYTDDRDDLEMMFRDVAEAGATHVVSSCLDIPHVIASDFYSRVTAWLTCIGRDPWEFVKIYDNNQLVGLDRNADMPYRKSLFSDMKKMATESSLTFSLCMEFEVIKKNGEKWYRGLNEDYMTSKACEGIDTPIYYRKDLAGKFSPTSSIFPCNGNCLSCAKDVGSSSCKGSCSCDPFMNAKSLLARDYKKFWESIKTRVDPPSTLEEFIEEDLT